MHKISLVQHFHKELELKPTILLKNWTESTNDFISGVARVGVTRGGNRHAPTFFKPFLNEKFRNF